MRGIVYLIWYCSNVIGYVFKKKKDAEKTLEHYLKNVYPTSDPKHWNIEERVIV